MSQSVRHSSFLVDLLRFRALHQPDQRAYTFLVDGEAEEVHLTYSELDRQARAIAARLQSLGATGERALCFYPPGLEYIAAFFGCLCAGVVAVPAYPPRPNRPDPRIPAIVTDAQATVALTTTQILSDMGRWFAHTPELKALRWLATDTVEGAQAEEWPEPEVCRDTLAFLQYTSGATATPKGVMVSHGNLLHNQRMIQYAFGHTAQSVVLGWLPLYHDMGLGNVLQPLFVGCPSILMPPAAFLQRPFRWLQAISRTRATTSGGPNFAYDLCVRQITPEQRETLDLSCWEVAFNGAEPVRAETLDRFVETFAPCGFRREAFYPCYGLAEATLIVSGGEKPAPPVIRTFQRAALERNEVLPASDENEDHRTFVGCGQTLPEQEMVIVNPETLTRCPSHQVGEIWVKGPSVAQGYWNQPDETEHTFQASLADTGEGPFLRTGDLGFLENGELFVTGRLKDLIIIRGVNHYPEDIEQTVEQSHPALRPGCGAAFSVDVAGEERLVVVVEVERASLRHLPVNEVAQAIRQAVSADGELEVYAVLLLKTGRIPKTTSGKIQRHACRAGFLEESLNVVGEWRSTIPPHSRDPAPNVSASDERLEAPQEASQTPPTAAVIEAWLMKRISGPLGIDPGEIDLRQPFTHYGLDSVQAVSITGDLERWLGRSLSPTLAWDYPTIFAVARYLAGETTPEASHAGAEKTPRFLTEPIAIIGIGCRFPGAKDPETFFKLLRDGVDAITEVPPSRWEKNAFSEKDPTTPEKRGIRWGGFLEQVDRFDAPFFGISPREAARMDPQQRLLLEVAWEALENAGQAPDQLAGSRTGVFIGMSSNDYSLLQFNDPAHIDAYASTGNAHSIAANRLSYLLDLRGPSLAVDTACSSSLVSVHLACQSLWSGESSMALAGGVNVILSAALTIAFEKAQMLSPDGRCKTFDARADGYVRGEGCGVVVLKRLSDALKDGDRILALIRGSAVNQDGLSNGLTAPNGLAQQAVIRQALENAGVAPSQISYVEAHGTGTPLGDPIEVQALAAVLGQGREPETPPQAGFKATCVLGSVKTNIGHLEAAAGIAGLIKGVLALTQEEIPPHLHLKQINPQIPLDKTPFEIAAERRPWLRGAKPRFAGVSSFGFGGTNCHVVMEEAPVPAAVAGNSERPLHLLTLSAKSEKALLEQTQRYEAYLLSHSEASLADVCFTANTGRSHFAYRLAAAAESTTQLGERLGAFAAGKPTAGRVSGQVQSQNHPKIAFLFTGQGAQYVNMGRQLYETQPTFRQTLDRCDDILRPDLEKPLLSVLYPEPGQSSPLDQTAYTQPALFALEYALAELWKSWGIEPAVVMGHSVGEYVAACVAGVFSLEDGLKLIADRGRLTQALPQEGEMAAVFADEARVFTAIEPYAQEVSIAAINGPEQIVISGARQAVEAVRAALEAEGVKTKKLKVSRAFHSPLMAPMLPAFERKAREVAYSPPRIDMISNVTGELAEASIATPEYWLSHVLKSVRFAQGMETLVKQGYDVFVEIGPKPTLLGLVRNCFPEAEGLWLPSLRQGQADWEQMLMSLGELYVRGVPVDWSGFDRDYPRRRLQLPTYPFQRQRYWIETKEGVYHKTAQLFKKGAGSRIVHPLLGQRLHLAGSSEIRFESQIRQDSPAYLKHHRVLKTVILSAAAYVEMALAAGAAVFKSDDLVLEDVVIQQALILPEDEVKTLQFILTPEETLASSFRIFSLITDEENSEPFWTLHASGKVRVADKDQNPLTVDLAALHTQCNEKISVKAYYQQFLKRGIDYGKSFQAIEKLWRHSGEALGQIRLPEALVLEAEDYKLHPVLQDGCFQVLGTAFPDAGAGDIYLPVGLERLVVCGHPGTSLWSHGRVRPVKDSNQQTLAADLCLFDETGAVVATVEGLSLKRTRREALLGTTQESLQNWLYEVEWQPQWRQGRQLPPEYLPTPEEISDPLVAQFTQLSAQQGIQVYAEVLPKLEALSVAYVVNAFEQMGWEFQPNQRFSTAKIAEQLGVVSQHRRLLGRLLEMLAEEGVLRQISDRWEVAKVPDIQDPHEQWNALFAQYPAAEAELTLFGRCGSRLATVLRGECDPLQLLFPEGDLTTATKLYRDSPVARVMNTLVQKAVSKALSRLPRGREVRVLEIGAGTGGTTSYILPHLPADQTEYVFTDVSPLFTSKAQEQFRDYPFMRYQLLDIEQEPQAQGLGEHQYDIILAAHVLHATRDLRETLKHVQQLLAPGGLLVLQEGTARLRFLDLIFGLTEGWWKFADKDLRPEYPLLSARKWQELLQESGFKEVVTIPPASARVGILSQQAVIVAQGPFAKPEEAERKPSSWLIFADGQGIGQQLGALLRERGEVCTEAFSGKGYEQLAEGEFRIDSARPADFQQLLNQVVGTNQPPLRGVVHCWSLDAVEAEALTGADLEAAGKKGCGSTLHLVQSLVQAGFSSPPTLWLVTRGAQPVGIAPHVPGLAQSPLWGMGKVIALEHPELNCVRVDLDPFARADEAQALLEEIWSEAKEDQVAFRDNVRYVARLVRRQAQAPVVEDRLDVPHDQPFQLEISARGTLEHLKLQPTTRRQPGAGEVEIRVRATGLNFRDVLNALDLYPGHPGPLGGECAGEVVAIGEGVEGFEIGEKVVAIAPGSFSQYVTVNAAMVVPKPLALNFEEAATIPVAFLTAYYTLHHLAKISAGDRVLLHAAAGGVGQAAVQLAQLAGASVLGTASFGKWDFLKSIGVEHVMNSRTLDFASEVMAATSGQGVDIVLNSLAGEFIPKSLSVLSARGRFLEIGKRGVWDPSQVAQEKPECSYFLVDLEQVCQQEPALVQSMLRRLMQQFKEGKLKPLPRKVFPIQEVVSAFRYMQGATHIGKIVVSQLEERVDSAKHPPIAFREDSTYLITGGLGGLGLLVAQWMVEQGARHLVLVGRRGPNDAVRSQLKELEQAGAFVVVAQADVSEAEQIARVLFELEQSLPPLRGIIHAAGVLDDGVLQKLDWERFAKVLAPKVKGAWNLHTLTQKVPLDDFVLFSSAASLLGSPGQANHVAANAFLDALAYYRRSQGLAGLSINWGAWSDVGAAAKRLGGEQMRIKGMGTIAPEQGLQVLSSLMGQGATQVGVLPVKWSKFLEQFLPGSEPPMLSELARQVRQQVKGEQPPVKPLELLRQLKEASSGDRQNLLLTSIQGTVAKVLGLSPSQLDVQQPLNNMGLDSLMAVELRNWVKTNLGVDVPMVKFMEGLSVAGLATLVSERLTAVHSTSSVAPPSQGEQKTGRIDPSKGVHPESAGQMLEKLDELTDEEVDALLNTVLSLEEGRS